jgi:hypothetical protein
VAFRTPATELLYGGAAGGGKSHLMRSAAILWAAEIPGLQVYLFRRIREDLVKNHLEGPKGFRSLLAPWVASKFVQIVEDEIRFWNGSKIYLCHVKDEPDRYKYQGAEIHVLLIDELTHFTEVIYRFLRSRVRAIGLNLPEQYKGRFPRILCGSNPGNIGHTWVKNFWIDGALDLQVREMPQSEGGMRHQFIAARLEDNPSLIEDDPNYEDRLSGLGSKALVQAMRFGDWNVVEGMFFGEFETHRHVIKPFRVPPHWTRFMSADWGSAVPFSIGWWAIVPDEFENDLPAFGADINEPNVPNLPRGSLVRYREWYGSAAHNNTGLKLTAEEVAEGIVKREAGEPRLDGRPRIAYRRMDPSAFKQDGGPSICERMAKPPYRIIWTRADNRRTGRLGAMGGWDMVRQRLKGDGVRPAIFFFETCVDAIRTFPLAQHDSANPEDIADCEDDCLDEIRYACMSRPYSSTLQEKEPTYFNAMGMQNGTIIIHDLDVEELGIGQRTNVARFERIR